MHNNARCALPKPPKPWRGRCAAAPGGERAAWRLRALHDVPVRHGGVLGGASRRGRERLPLEMRRFGVPACLLGRQRPRVLDGIAAARCAPWKPEPRPREEGRLLPLRLVPRVRMAQTAPKASSRGSGQTALLGTLRGA